MNRVEAQAHLRRLLLDGATVTVRRGHRRKVHELRCITVPQIRWVLRTGAVIEDPVWDLAHYNWRVMVQGKDPDDRLLTISVGMDIERRELWIITGFPK